MTKSSTYLYAEENRGLYQKTLDDFNSKECVFTRNLIPYLEKAESSPSAFYEKHLMECGQCQERAREWKRQISLIEAQIPFVRPSIESRNLFKRECRQVIELALLQKRTPSKITREQVLSGVQGLGKDFLKSLISPDFLRGIVVAACSALFLYFVL